MLHRYVQQNIPYNHVEQNKQAQKPNQLPASNTQFTLSQASRLRLAVAIVVVVGVRSMVVVVVVVVVVMVLKVR